MRRTTAASGSALFFAVAPAVVAGAVPWSLTGWHSHGSLAHWWPVRLMGAALTFSGVLVLVTAFGRFVLEGVGTPAPVAPTERLVTGGLYRYVRNPMYVAVTAAIIGQALVLQRAVLLVYASVAWFTMAAFARWYEEPALARRFGAEYDAYRGSVRPWRPRRPRHVDRP